MSNPHILGGIRSDHLNGDAEVMLGVEHEEALASDLLADMSDWRLLDTVIAANPKRILVHKNGEVVDAVT